MLLIKMAAEDSREAVNKQQLVKTLKNIGIGAGAFGLGAGAAGLAMNKMLPPVLQRMTPTQRAATVAGAGLLSAAGAVAFKKAMERNKDLVRDETVGHK